MRLGIALAAIAALGGCVARPGASDAPIAVKIIAFNDFHGNLEPPRQAIDAPGAGGMMIKVPAGGAAHLASAIAALRAKNPNALVVSAGDMTGASPLVSSYFLDEPTVAAMNLIGLDLNAAGNHEFDRGSVELLRLQNGGCDPAVPAQCRVEPFAGAKFAYLAANTMMASGTSLLPGTAIRTLGSGARSVKIGFIGLTTRTTGILVSPSGIPGISFADEAATANALVPKLRAEGADAIVVLIHEGGDTKGGYDDKGCPGLSGAIRPILDALDPAIDLVVSGHTHKAYVCDYGRYDAARPILLTSAGNAGRLITDITLRIDPRTRRVVGKSADNVIVQGEGYTLGETTVTTTDRYPRFAADPRVKALVDRYAAEVEKVRVRPAGRLTAIPAFTSGAMRETELGNMIADAQLAATRKDGAQIAFMNPTGVRASLTPDARGSVSYGAIYAVQPFGNVLMVRRYTGAQIRAVLEQQFDKTGGPMRLQVAGMRYSFDRSRPAGQRIIAPTVDGQPLRADASYTVTISNFLAFGGDGFSAFSAGSDVAGGISDLEALEAYLSRGAPVTPPTADRTTDVTPPAGR